MRPHGPLHSLTTRIPTAEKKMAEELDPKSVPEDVKRAAARAVSLLVEREFDELESLTNAIRTKATDMRRVLDDYLAQYGGNRFVLPPQLDAAFVWYAGASSSKVTWFCDFDLWTEHGRSDLTCELE